MISINPNPVIPPLSRASDKRKVDIRYSLISPYANAHIFWDNEGGELVYDLEEPSLDDSEKVSLKRLEEAMLELINVNIVVDNTTESLMEYIDKTAKLLIEELGLKIEEDSYEKIFYYLYRNFIGLNEIEPLLSDYFIEDIECNGINTPVYIVHRIYRNIRTNLRYEDVDKLAGFIEKLAQRSGKYISYAEPLLDGSLPDGSRVNATYTKDVTSKGPTFTIRKFTKVPWTPTQLIALNTLSPEMLAYFWLLIEYKSNIFITGGTASGKTTLLNALAFFIPPEARVVSIEDSVTGDSKLIIKKNEKIKNVTIKEFVDKKIDAEVMTIDNNGLIKWTKPSDYIRHNVKKDIYEVRTSTGRKINVTQDHSLFTLGEDNSLKEVKPIDLENNKSFIAVPRSLPIKGQKLTELNLMDKIEIFKDDFLVGKPVGKIFNKYSRKDLGVSKERYSWWKKKSLIKISELLKLKVKFSYEELKELRIKSKNKSSLPVIFGIDREFLEFCGLWLGDGSYDNYNKNAVIVSNTDEECRKLAFKISEKLNINYSFVNDGGVSLRLHSTIFYKFLKGIIGLKGYSKTKKIPSLIFGLSNEQVKHFIRGYFSADGCVKKFEVSCASQSRDLLDDLQTLFLRMGAISRIRDNSRKDKCIELSISSSENIEKFRDIGFLQERKNEKLSLLNKKAHHTITDVVPMDLERIKELNRISAIRIQHRYMKGLQRIGRNYMQKIAPIGSEFNDLSHNDILWDKVRDVRKISSGETEVFDLSIPKYEKFICNNIFVHNTRELNLPRENWIPSVARVSVGTGSVGEIDLFDLLKNSFRQNPDYVIVGEVRGKEAYVLFQGMASGHPSISTMHADSVDTMIKRLETPPIELSPTLVNTLDCVVTMTHAIVNKKETRRLRDIVEIVNVKSDGTAFINTPFVWNPAQDIFYFKKESKVLEKISARYGLSVEELQNEFMKRAKLLYALYQKRVFGFEDMRKIVNNYYKDPESVMAKYGLQGK